MNESAQATQSAQSTQVTQTIRAVALPPDDALVSGVHRIANALQRKRGYQTTISVCDTRTIMEAAYLLVKQAQEGMEEYTDDECVARGH